MLKPSSTVPEIQPSHFSGQNQIFYIGFLDLIWVTPSAENIDLARKRKLGPKKRIGTIEKNFVQ